MALKVSQFICLAVLMLLCGACGKNSSALGAFANAKTPDGELKEAQQLNSLHLQIAVQFFDADHKIIQTDAAVKAPDKVVFLEVQLKGGKIEKKILNPATVHALLQE
jgi:hypothetical protein